MKRLIFLGIFLLAAMATSVAAHPAAPGYWQPTVKIMPWNWGPRVVRLRWRPAPVQIQPAPIPVIQVAPCPKCGQLHAVPSQPAQQ